MTDDDNTQLILVSRIETRWDTLDFDPPIPLAKAELIGRTLADTLPAVDRKNV
jgi:hypothetical protein